MVKRFLQTGEYTNKTKKRTVPCDSTILDLQPLEKVDPEIMKWQKPCMRLGGALNWVAWFTRQDIGFALNACMKCVGGASEHLYLTMLGILSFLEATASRKLTYGTNADSNLRKLVIDNSDSIRHDIFRPGDPITFVDTGGGARPMQSAFVTLHGGLIGARISRISSPTLSQCEAEWFGATAGVTLLQSLEPVLSFLGNDHGLPMILFCDNKAACMLSDSNHSTRRMRHVAVRLAYLQERVNEGFAMLIHINTSGNIADLGTKPLPAKVFHYLCSYIWS